MVQKQNDCVHCDTCLNCGAKDPYSVVLCDKCGQQIDYEDNVYIGFDSYTHLCSECALELLESVGVQDLVEVDDDSY